MTKRFEVQVEKERNKGQWSTLETMTLRKANAEYPGYKDFFRVAVVREHRFLLTSPCFARLRLIKIE